MISGKPMKSLAQKTVIGFIQLILGLGCMLFIPAGTFDFWQAWVYLFIFGAAIALILIYLYKKDRQLLERRLNRTEKGKNQQGIQVYIYVTYNSLFIVSSLDHRFLLSIVPLLAVIVGDILVMLGYFIIFLVLKENSFAAATIEVAPDQKVISTGPYAIIRHPMYFGAIVMLLGTPLALGAWWGLLVFFMITGIVVWRLLEEEKFLSRDLSGYKEYCQKVRYRLVPFIW